MLEAAEQAAARGLWVAGFVTYEAAPGLDPALGSDARPSSGSVRRPARSRGSRCSRDARRRLPAASPRRVGGRSSAEPVADPATAWRPSMTRRDYDAAIGPDPSSTSPPATRTRSTARCRCAAAFAAIPGACTAISATRSAAPTAAYLDTGRYRVLSASPELFFRIDERPHRHEADEGHRAARPVARRGRGDPRRARGLGEGSRRERDDRRPAPQRHRARRPQWVRHVERRLRGRALRDRLAADVDRRRRACVPRSGSPTSSGAVPLRIGHRGAQGVDDADHRRTRGCGARGVLRDGRVPRARRRARPDARASTWRSGRCCRTRGPARPIYGVGGGITWDSRAAAEYDETVAKARVLTTRRPALRLLETLAFEPGTGYRRLDEHLARLRASAVVPRHDPRRGRDPRGARPGGRSLHEARARPTRGRPPWPRGDPDRRPSRRRSSPSGWPSIVPTRSTRPTRCCSTRRPRVRATTGARSVPGRGRRRAGEHPRPM